VKSYLMMSGMLGVLFSLTVIWFIRKDQMHVQYSLWWLTVALIAILLGLNPTLIDQAAQGLGVDYPPTLLFLWGIIALFFKALLGDVERTRSQRRVLRLTQRVVMLEEHIERLEQRLAAQERKAPPPADGHDADATPPANLREAPRPSSVRANK
jgi:hypothetical protein